MPTILIVFGLSAALMGLAFLTLVARKGEQLNQNFARVHRLRQREERIRRNRSKMAAADDGSADTTEVIS